tara:strand:- start:1389 stop:1538 length:150 start_codon:yes stop_codon:yes gene_type:complete
MFIALLVLRIREILLALQELKRSLFSCVNGEDMSPIPAVNSDESIDSMI